MPGAAVQSRDRAKGRSAWKVYPSTIRRTTTRTARMIRGPKSSSTTDEHRVNDAGPGSAGRGPGHLPAGGPACAYRDGEHQNQGNQSTRVLAENRALAGSYHSGTVVENLLFRPRNPDQRRNGDARVSIRRNGRSKRSIAAGITRTSGHLRGSRKARCSDRMARFFRHPVMTRRPACCMSLMVSRSRFLRRPPKPHALAALMGLLDIVKQFSVR